MKNRETNKEKQDERGKTYAAAEVKNARASVKRRTAD
jgi:hypothetical protein